MRQAPFKVLREAPEVAPHILIVLSEDPDTILNPSMLIQTDVTSLLWPLKVLRQAPVVASHILIVLSSDPDTILDPSLLIHTDVISLL